MKEKNTASSGKKKKTKQNIAFMFTQFNLSRRGRGRVGGNPPFRPETCLGLNFLHRQARI